jgi:uncharacterized membrane protein YqjE
MDVENVRRGEVIAGISGVALIIIMFLSWWSFDIDTGAAAQTLGVDLNIDTSFNAWQASDLNDIIWFITALFAVALGLVALSQTDLNMPVALSSVTAGLGILSLVLIVIRIIDPPGQLDRSYGVFLGLLAICGIVYGAWMAMQEEGTSFTGEADRTRDRAADREGPPPPPPPSS